MLVEWAHRKQATPEIPEMDYYESAEGVIISPERAKKEVEKHSASWEEFVQDMGLRNSYEAQAVLVWLGY